MQEKTKPYGYVKNMMLFEAAYFDKRLQNATRLVLGLIIRHTQQDHISRHFSIYETAKRKNISRQATQNQVKKLIKFKYIERHINREGFRTQYKLLFDNLPATQSDCPQEPATQLGCPEATSRNCPPATQLDCSKKMRDNNKIKKEKNAQVRETFLNSVEEEINEHAFQEVGNIAANDIRSCARGCWDTWASKDKFPEGDQIAAFKNYLRKGLRDKHIREASDKMNESNARQALNGAEFLNPLEPWHEKIEPIVGTPIFKSWLRPCWHDGNGKLCAPNPFIAQRLKERWQDDIYKVLGNVDIVHQPYKSEKL